MGSLAIASYIQANNFWCGKRPDLCNQIIATFLCLYMYIYTASHFPPHAEACDIPVTYIHRHGTYMYLVGGHWCIDNREGGNTYICHVVTSQRMLDKVHNGSLLGFYHVLYALQVHEKASLFKLST